MKITTVRSQMWSEQDWPQRLSNSNVSLTEFQVIQKRILEQKFPAKENPQQAVTSPIILINTWLQLPEKRRDRQAGRS